MKIIQPIKCEWKCTKYEKINYETYFNAPGITRVQCDYCGEEYIASR